MSASGTAREKAVIGIDGATGIKELDLHGRQKGWNACIDKILDNLTFRKEKICYGTRLYVTVAAKL